MRKIGLDRPLGPAGHRDRDLVIAMIVARLTARSSKLATAKALSPLTAALTRNTTVTPLNDKHELILYARPTPIQTKAFDLLGIKPERAR